MKPPCDGIIWSPSHWLVIQHPARITNSHGHFFFGLRKRGLLVLSKSGSHSMSDDPRQRGPASDDLSHGGPAGASTSNVRVRRSCYVARKGHADNEMKLFLFNGGH